MKTRFQIIVQTLTLFAAVLLAVPAFGQTGAKLRLDSLSRLEDKAESVVDITIGPEMMELAAKFLKNSDDPDTEQVSKLLSGVKEIVVKSFEFETENQFTSADIDAIRSQVKGPGWNRLVGARSKKNLETAEVYALMAAGKVEGVVLLVSSPKELTVINISGMIDIEKLSLLKKDLDIPRVVLERTDKTNSN